MVPADNSCLFTSINYCMSGEVVASENSAFMREVIASVVAADQNKYSEAILGRANKAYCNWIQGKDAWGGAIEVQILAEYFQVEIMVVDTKSGQKPKDNDFFSFLNGFQEVKQFSGKTKTSHSEWFSFMMAFITIHYS